MPAIEQQPEIRPDALIVTGVTHNNKACRLIDNSASLQKETLESLLKDLIEQQVFGLKGLSSSGGNTLVMGAPEFNHIQLEERLYQIILLPYDAYLEPF